MSVTNEDIASEILDQIMQAVYAAIQIGIDRPIIRTTLSRRTLDAYRAAFPQQGGCISSPTGEPMKLHGSFLSVIEHPEIWCFTRIVNFPK